jgi:4-azaleucine resistance transporter AzlC
VLGGLGFIASAGGFGLVYGLAARGAGFSAVDALAMSLFVLAGASQFAAVGLVAQGAGWPSIVLLTALLNARHLLYSAALAPWLAGRPRLERAAMAHVLTDETFGLAIAHFRRLGRTDVWGYWVAAAFVCLPWPVATVIGVLGGQAIPDPARIGLDVVFPAAMAGLAVGLVTGRRELVAAIAGASVAVIVGIAVGGAAVGVVAGGLLGPLIGLAVPERRSTEAAR